MSPHFLIIMIFLITLKVVITQTMRFDEESSGNSSNPRLRVLGNNFDMRADIVVATGIITWVYPDVLVKSSRDVTNGAKEISKECIKTLSAWS